MERKRLKKGDIVLVTFPFTDLSGEKRRPALVAGLSEEHIVVAFISTHASGPVRWHVSLNPDQKNGLVSPSLIRSDKILSVDFRLIAGAIGVAPKAVIRNVELKLRSLLKL